jgi:hypothetical protein
MAAEGLPVQLACQAADGGADCYSIRVDGIYRAHGKYDRDESVWSAVEIGTHKAMGHG